MKSRSLRLAVGVVLISLGIVSIVGGALIYMGWMTQCFRPEEHVFLTMMSLVLGALMTEDANKKM